MELEEELKQHADRESKCLRTFGLVGLGPRGSVRLGAVPVKNTFRPTKIAQVEFFVTLTSVTILA